MVDGAATGALQAPSVAPSSGHRPVNGTNALPVVPATPASGEASGTVAAVSFTAMRKVVEFKEMGMGALASTCGLGMALKAMADSEKNPILIEGALSLCNLLVAALATRATVVLPRRCERVCSSGCVSRCHGGQGRREENSETDAVQGHVPTFCRRCPS